MSCEGGRKELPQKKPAVISISCVRTVHVHSVCSGQTLPGDFSMVDGFG